MKKTKIVCTIGPSTEAPEMLEGLIEAGMDMARLNFSHGTHETHGRVMELLRSVATRKGREVAILQDLCGPKIRVGEIAGGSILLVPGEELVLTSEEIVGDSKRVSISYPNLASELAPQDRVLIDDGLMDLKVEETSPPEVRCRVITGGILYPHKGVNFPGTSLRVPSLTDKDIEDLHFGLSIGIDFVAVSFVRRSDDIVFARRIMEAAGRVVPIIAKIEKQEAVQNFEEILEVSDGIMIARGDLGVEAPVEEVPVIQKRLIRRCNEVSKPVITATQMLDSMIRNPRPTRAEVTDVSNAIIDGTDAVMLSGETASGKYPIEAVKMMARIIECTEPILPYERIFAAQTHKRNALEAISLATCEMAETLGARAILVSTSSGRTAKAISRYRPRAPILAAVSSVEVERRLLLSWGVFPIVVPHSIDSDDLMESASRSAVSSGLAGDGDLVILTAGIPGGMRGSTNMIKVHILGHIFLRGTGVGPDVVVVGKACLADSVALAKEKVEEGDILVTRRLDSSFAPILQHLSGVITAEGGADSEGAMLCQKTGIPGVLGVSEAMSSLADGRMITLDVERGIVSEPG